MSKLNIRMLGSLQIDVDGESKLLPTRKVNALLVYLAMTRQPQRRDLLATLLWADFDTDRAKTSLRRAIADINKKIGKDWLLIDRQQIELNPAADVVIDVEEFSKKLKTNNLPDLEMAIKIYAGDFLEGFFLKDSPAFDEWQFFERESLRSELADGLQQVIKYQREANRFEQGIIYGRRLVGLDPLHEPAQRLLISLYAESGKRAAAIRQFEECKRVLDEELGVEPEKETQTLFEQIQKQPSEKSAQKTPNQPGGSKKARVGDQDNQSVPVVDKHNLPNPKTSFVGREAELAQIVEMIGQDNVRLLSIIGLGGIGKTRLAMQAGHSLVSQYADGIWFIDAIPAESDQNLAVSISQTLSIPLRGNVSPKKQLVEELAQKEMLLIIDNFEHLVDFSPFVSFLLSQTEFLKIVVTSREVLDLTEEWLYALDGLPFPAEPTLEAKEFGGEIEEPDESYGAISLFIQRAKQVNHQFKFREHLEHIATICRMVDGMPLAIELSAAWVRMLTCEKIIEKIQHSLDFLSATHRNVTDRHLSIRAVFETSWQMLLSHEQQALAQLSIMRGAFTADAAEAVSETSIFTLNGLINKSLLRTQGQNHFVLHELLRQFAADKLEQLELPVDPAYERLSTYYLTMLHANEESLFGAEQTSMLDQMGHEIDNIYQAWVWAVHNGRIEALSKGYHSLYNYHSMRSLYLQGERIFDQTIQLLQAGLPSGEMEQAETDVLDLLVRLMAGRGEYLYIVGNMSLAESTLQVGLNLSNATSNANYSSEIVQLLGIIYYLQGHLDKAFSFSERSLKSSRENDALHGQALALMNMGAIQLAQGKYQEAQDSHLESLKIYEAIEYKWGVANCFRFLSTSAIKLDDLANGKSFAEKSFKLSEELQYETGMAMALNNLGLISQLRGEIDKASSLYQRSLALSRESYVLITQINALRSLGSISKLQLDDQLELKYLNEALSSAVKTGATPLVLDIILDVLANDSYFLESAQSASIIKFIEDHNQTNLEIKRKAKKMLDKHQDSLKVIESLNEINIGDLAVQILEASSAAAQ